jgi:hypothetical protein
MPFLFRKIKFSTGLGPQLFYLPSNTLRGFQFNPEYSPFSLAAVLTHVGPNYALNQFFKIRARQVENVVFALGLNYNSPSF